MAPNQPVLPEIVARQLETIRREGTVNMLDRRLVQVLALQHEFYELVDYITSAPQEYSKIIFLGAVIEGTGQSIKDVEPF